MRASGFHAGRNCRRRRRQRRHRDAQRLEPLEPRRLLAAAGDLDLGFGFLGKTNTTYATGGVDDSGDAIAVAGDGKIFVGGNVWAGDGFATLTRYNHDGTRDATFGSGGTIKFTNLPWRSVREIDGLLSGSVTMLSTEAAAAGKPLLHRVLTTGAADSSWVGPGTSIPGKGIAIEQQYVLTSSALARLNSNGTLSTTFGTGGLFTFPAPASPDFLRYDPQAMTVLSGAIYVAGERVGITTGERRAYVQRYTSAGALDTAWAGGGTFLLPNVSATDSAARAITFSGNFIIVAGRNGADTFVARFTGATAAMDMTFGTGGVFTFDAAPGSADFAHAIVRGSLGAVYLGGVTETGPYIASVTSGGALDSAYDGNGIIEQPLPAGWPVFGGANITAVPFGSPSGNLVMATAAAASLNENWDQVLAAYTPAGALNTNFAAASSNPGIARVNLTHPQSLNRLLGSVTQGPPDNPFTNPPPNQPVRLVQFGTSRWVAGNVAVNRLNPDGTPDTTFGVGGVVEIDLGAHDEIPLDAFVQSDAKIVIVGRADSLIGPPATASWRHEYFVLRLNENGTLDTSFGTGGFTKFQYTDGFWGYFDQVSVIADGRIYAAGMFQDASGNAKPLVAQFSSTGVLNMAFGGTSTGRRLIDLPGENERITAMITGPGYATSGPGTGIVIAGSVDTTATNTDRFVGQLDLAGNISPAGGGGFMRILDAGPEETVAGLFVDPSTLSPGHVYVGGTAGSNVVLTRLTYYGAVDTAFGTAGTASAPLPAGTVGLVDMRRSASGQFVFGGTVTRPGTSDDDFLVMRLTPAGAPDTTFGGGDGNVAVDMGTSDDAARNLHIAPNGRIIIAGSRSGDTLTEWAAARLFEQEVAPLSLAARRVQSFGGGPRFELTINGAGVQGAEDRDLFAVNLATGERINTFFVGFGGSSIPNTTARSWTLNQTMPNGLYKIVVPAGALADSAGNPLGEYSFDFFVHNGSSGPDLFMVRRLDATNVRVSYNPGSVAAAFFDVPAPAVDFGTAIVLNGGTAGDDVFVVEYTAGELPPVSITPDGGAGVDALTYLSAAGATFDLTAASLITRTGVAGPVASTLFSPGVDSIAIAGATYNFTGPTLNKHLDVRDDAVANFNVTQRLGRLSISGQANVPAGGNKVILTRGLTITGDGYLDLADNDLAIDYDATAPSPLGAFNATAGSYDGVTGMIARASNWGAWDQPGLRTTTDAARVAQIATLAPAEAAGVLFLEPGQTALWNGVTVDDTTVLVKYTYTGDLNLDGLIDGADYGIIDNYVQFPGTDGYANGDFNYDGVIDGADYGLIDNAIQFQGDAL